MIAIGKIVHRDPSFTATRDSDSFAAPVEELVDHPIVLPFGDWVETWAKPIGCWLDRTTKKLPWQLAKIRIEKGRIYVTPPRPRWQRLLLACRLPACFRTQFCGCSACSKRRRYLNAVIPDLRQPRAWFGLINPALHRRAFNAIYRPLQSPR